MSLCKLEAAYAWGAERGNGFLFASLRADALLAELEQSSKPAPTSYMLLTPSSRQQDAPPGKPPASSNQKPLTSAAPKVMPGAWEGPLSPQKGWECWVSAERCWGLSHRDLSFQVPLPPRSQPSGKSLESVYR